MHFFLLLTLYQLIKKHKLKIDIYAPMGSKNDPIIEKFVKNIS